MEVSCTGLGTWPCGQPRCALFRLWHQTHLWTVCNGVADVAGHLAALSATDVYRYLAQEHDATTAAVLLGMAAARRASLDAGTAKMLFLHVPARWRPHHRLANGSVCGAREGDGVP